MPAKQIDENIYLEDEYNEELDELNNEEKSTPQAKGRKPKSDDEEEEEQEDNIFGLKADEEEE